MKYRVIKKTRKFMYPYIAMHGHLTQRDRPDRMEKGETYKKAHRKAGY